jgi:large subunit ribosomal protein L3
MKKFILGKKLGMTTLYKELEAQNITLIECSSKVTLLRSEEKDGYQAVQLSFSGKSKKETKKEFRTKNSLLKVGDILNVEIFNLGERVFVTGTSKAKGFQGVVKRHGFKGGPKSHGHKHNLRAPGSIGSGFPEHVTKGKKMAGRMGGTGVTSQNLKVVLIDKETNLIGLKGAVPGITGSLVKIYKK